MASVASATATLACEGDLNDDALSNLPLRTGSNDAVDGDDEDVVATEVSTEEGEVSLLSASEDVPSENGPKVDVMVFLASGKENDSR